MSSDNDINNKTSALFNYFNSYIQSANELSACGPECEKQKKTDELKKMYADSQTNLKTAPEQVSMAAKNYYMYAEGPEGYNTFAQKTYQKEGQGLADQLKTDLLEAITNAEFANDNYNTMYFNSQHSLELYLKYLHDVSEGDETWIKKENEVMTNNRKSYYEDQGIDSLQFWNKFYFIMYIFHFLGLLIALYFNKTTSFFMKILWILFFIIYPFVIVPLFILFMKGIKYVYHLLPRNVYLTM